MLTVEEELIDLYSQILDDNVEISKFVQYSLEHLDKLN
jgi:hypothetical protein